MNQDPNTLTPSERERLEWIRSLAEDLMRRSSSDSPEFLWASIVFTEASYDLGEGWG